MSLSALIIGGGSSIGQELIPFLRNSGIPVSFTDRPTRICKKEALPLDLANLPKDLSFLGEPATAIILAGVAGERACETDPAIAKRVNIEAPVRLGEYFASRGSFCIFISTSQVFGTSLQPPTEAHPTTPQGLYGTQKEAAERFFLSQGTNASVVRVTKVITKNFQLFSDWAASLRAGISVHAYTDRFIAPVSTSCLLEVLKAVMQRKLSGALHLSAREQISYVEAARRIACFLSADEALVIPVPDPHPTASSAQLASLRLGDLNLPALPQAIEAIDWWLAESQLHNTVLHT